VPVFISGQGLKPVTVEIGHRAVIGRDPHLDVTLPHPRISRQHADIRYRDGEWVVTDLNSANGTFRDGERVTELVLTEPTTTISIGKDTGFTLMLTLAPEVDDTAVTTLPKTGEKGAGHIPLPPRLTMGRSNANDVVVDEPGVAEFQASITLTNRGFHELVDNTDNTVTTVNQVPVSQRYRLAVGDVIAVGGWSRRYTGNALEPLEAKGGFSFVADGLRVIAGEKTLIDDISFQLRPRTLTAVIGPSGAGKSTLLGALTGRRQATEGRVLVGGLDLYDNYPSLKNRIGLVPQSDLLHTTLTTRKALEYAAGLRFPRDVSPDTQRARVGEVIDLLGLTERQDLKIEALSGGQRKRASVALELLTQPELLFLDEPTSGLDPGLDRQVMNQLRDLANGGRTVLVVTHSVANLDVCDEVILLAPGGKLAYHGPAHRVLPEFQAADWSEVFDKLGKPDALPARKRPVEPRRTSEVEKVSIPPAKTQRWITQLSTLITRYLKVISSDKYFLLLLAALPFVLAMVGYAVGTDYGFGPGSDDDFGLNPQARPLLLVLILGASFMGLSASVQELVKERTIYERERSVGLSASAYITSKVLVLGVLVSVQTTIFVLITLASREMPDSGVVLSNPVTEVLIATLALALASMLLGLLISALVNSSEVTMPALVLTTMGQVVLSGAVPIRQTGLLDVVGLPNPGYWAMNQMATTADLNTISALSEDDQGAFWEAVPENWRLSLMVVVGLATAMLIATRLVLWRREQ
jgi:ABC-type multidrug transport system ATPase subunit/pSer/pThr/pTyr-binding forkhead associated (FHA) protein